jgi:hypothetical protein
MGMGYTLRFRSGLGMYYLDKDCRRSYQLHSETGQLGNSSTQMKSPPRRFLLGRPSKKRSQLENKIQICIGQSSVIREKKRQILLDIPTARARTRLSHAIVVTSRTALTRLRNGPHSPSPERTSRAQRCTRLGKPPLWDQVNSVVSHCEFTLWAIKTNS